MMIEDKLTESIISCAYKVHNNLGGGFLEKIYQKAMTIELEQSGLLTVCEQPISVYYSGQLIGSYFADIVVENKILLELKSVENLSKSHEVQIVNYLIATGYDLGLLINFGPTKVSIKRKTRIFSPLTGWNLFKDD